MIINPYIDCNQETVPCIGQTLKSEILRFGHRTLVLNAISAQREKNLNEYADFVRTRPLLKRVRKASPQIAITRRRYFLGAPQQEGRITHLSVYRTSCKVHRVVQSREFERYGESRRGKIDSFSDKSRRNLKFVASNCFPLLVSQFCLSYGSDNIPADGIQTHLHLKRFLDVVRRKYPGSTYLWVLEFQRRGVPHFHVFFSFPPSPQKHQFLADTWVRVTGGSVAQQKVHEHQNNFTKWDMGKGGYVCKYIEKEEQKHVPPEFMNVGRFWGCSRNMVPSPDQLFFDHLQETFVCGIDKITGEVHGVSITKLLYRSLRRHHESTIRSCGKKRISRITKTYLSTVNLPSGGLVVRQVLDWCMREDLKSKGLPGF